MEVRLVFFYHLLLVTVDVKSRVITVKGKRGSVTKSFKHLKVEITPGEKKVGDKTEKILKLNSYLVTYKRAAVLNTIKSHIENMIKGVTDVIK